MRHRRGIVLPDLSGEEYIMEIHIVGKGLRGGRKLVEPNYPEIVMLSLYSVTFTFSAASTFILCLHSHKFLSFRNLI